MFESLVRSGGYVWKFTSRLTTTQKYKLRSRMKQVDENIKNIYQGLIAMKNKSMGEPTGLKKLIIYNLNFLKKMK